jgi:hypothetical protein
LKGNYEFILVCFLISCKWIKKTVKDKCWQIEVIFFVSHTKFDSQLPYSGQCINLRDEKCPLWGLGNTFLWGGCLQTEKKIQHDQGKISCDFVLRLSSLVINMTPEYL